MTPPRITISLDADAGDFFLEATSYGQCMPAGPRLFRANPPDVLFRHTEYQQAQLHMVRLQSYLDAAFSGKARKTKGEEAEIVQQAPVDISSAWWL